MLATLAARESFAQSIPDSTPSSTSSSNPPIQMLPPVNEGTTTACNSGGSEVLTWDGVKAISCASNITASGGKLTAPQVAATTQVTAPQVAATTQVTTPEVTIPTALGALNVQSLNTLINLMNVNCPAGEGITKTGATTFGCGVLATGGGGGSGSTATCGAAANWPGYGNVYWNNLPSGYLCGSGSTNASAPISSGGQWTWSCINSTSGLTTTCNAEVPSYTMDVPCGSAVDNVVITYNTSATLPPVWMTAGGTQLPLCGTGYTYYNSLGFYPSSPWQNSSYQDLYSWTCDDASGNAYTCNAIGD